MTYPMPSRGVAGLLVFASVFAWGEPLQVKEGFKVTEERLALTRDYANRHYAMDHYQLETPQAIVIHYTVTRNLKDTWEVFNPDRLPAQRSDLARFGALNVGVHYIVDQDGTIYRMLPETVMGRHAIGLNYCAIGIENVGMSAKALTPAQLKSNIRLVHDLVSRHPSIQYLLGHHELADRSAPHAALVLMMDESNQPRATSDPSPHFIKALRDALSQEGIRLER